MSRPIEILVDAVHTACEYLLRPLDLLPARTGLICFSILSGAGMLWLFGRFTNQRLLGHARDRISAAVYEVRLFIDFPRRIFSAQKAMLYWSLRYLIATLPPIAILTLPFGALLPHLEARYGVEPLPTGRPVLLQVVCAQGTKAPVSVSVPDGVKVTAPPLHVVADNRYVFRLQVAKGIHDVVVHVGDVGVTKTLVADPNASRVSVDRRAGASHVLSIGHEDVLSSDSGIELVRVEHPARSLSFLGFVLPWWAIWLLVSTISALLLRKPFGVVL